MDEDTKRQCDVIMKLRDESWKRIFERRHYEWRAAYTLWAALGAFIVIALTNKGIFVSHNCFTLAGVIIIGAALCIFHGLWLKGLGRATDDDRQIAIHYEKKLRSLSKSELEGEREKELDKHSNKQRGLFGDWSRSIQFFVTMVLSIAVIGTVWVVGN